jgi:hypothetical protein
LDDPERPTGGGGSVRSTRWRHGHYGRSSVLHGYGALFLVFSLPTKSMECKELTKGGLLLAGGSGAGRAAVRFEPQPSAMVEERSKGWLTTRLGQRGAARNVEHRRRVDGARVASQATWQ